MEKKAEISEASFTIRRNREMRKKQTLLAVIGFLSNIMFLIFAFHFSMVLYFWFFVACLIVGTVLVPAHIISMALWEVNVRGEEIRYKSLFQKRTFTFHEIKRASTHKNETGLYSLENKKLFSVMTNDSGYDLFLKCLTARNINTVRAARPKH